jgi:hypothetical protein
MGVPPTHQRGGRRLPIAIIAIVAGGALILCSACAGLFVGFYFAGGSVLEPVTSAFASATRTPTPDKNAPVPLRSKGLLDSGLEITVINVQRPLKVEGNVKLPPNEQFILVTVRLVNTKKTGTPIPVNAAEFKVKGGGGLTYEANPKAVTIPQMLTQTTLVPGKDMEGELIFQIASDDWDLKLNYTSGKTTRVFLLEKQ